MAFSDFTLRDVTDRFGLAVVEVPDLFLDVPDFPPSPLMTAMLARFLPLALAIDTGKARSEYVVAPLLGELSLLIDPRVSLYSGISFPAVGETGLSGFCDFILARSPDRFVLRSPVAVIVEAKNDNIKSGLGQCVAAMLAARRFNEKDGTAVPVILPKLLGILVRCWTPGDAA